MHKFLNLVSVEETSQYTNQPLCDSKTVLDGEDASYKEWGGIYSDI
jgi:hypothetical protein